MRNTRGIWFAAPAAAAVLFPFFMCPAQGLAQQKPPTAPAPSITITKAPPAGGGEDSWGTIAGRTTGANPAEQRVVIYARTDQWYVQPWVAKPFTPLRKDGSFQTGIHLGEEYAALLVDHSFDVQPTFPLADLSVAVPGILAVARADAASR
jgi:hypothetical protein